MFHLRKYFFFAFSLIDIKKISENDHMKEIYRVPRLCLLIKQLDEESATATMVARKINQGSPRKEKFQLIPCEKNRFRRERALCS